jgi:branched-chain amino acid transport system permease protein
VVSVGFERTLFRRLYRASELDQVLLTIGLVFISVAVAAYIFGTDQQPLQLPSYLRSSLTFMGLRFAVYRLILLGLALAITLALVLGIEYTRFGARVRAAVDNQRLASTSIALSQLHLRSAAGSPGSAARWRSRSLGSILLSPSPI